VGGVGVRKMRLRLKLMFNMVCGCGVDLTQEHGNEFLDSTKYRYLMNQLSNYSFLKKKNYLREFVVNVVYLVVYELYLAFCVLHRRYSMIV
jgi:hypothetical protein